MHGVYSSTNTRKEYALAGVNMPLKAWRTTSPPAEAEKLANMESELTTASFATTPVSSATLACHDPKPSGLNMGAIAEPIAPGTAARYRQGRGAGHKYAEEVPGQGKVQGINKTRSGGYYDDALMPTTRNKRDVWLINTVPYKGGHFAAYPPKLAETCILAGCPAGGVVLDPFFGSGTTGLAAKSLDRRYIGIELNTEYCALAGARIGGGNT